MKGVSHMMSYNFNIDEVFEMAEQIERNGASFYRQMSGKSLDSSVQQLFLDLALIEEEHEKVFRSMRADLSDKEQLLTAFDPEGEAALYLRALADLRVFDREAEEDFSLAEGLSEKQKIIKVLRGAIDREKESIIFYLGIKELVPETLGKNKMDGIIKEEMEHIRLLGDQFLSIRDEV
jgi:rubrerythrin